MTSEPAPVTAAVIVPVSAVEAFSVFTGRIGEWWDPRLSPDPGSWSGLEIEGRLGGEVTMLIGDEPYAWGTVTAWEPGVRYAQTVTLGVRSPTMLEIGFVDSPDGCHVVLAHDGWVSGDEQARAEFSESVVDLLQRYATLVTGS